MSTINQKECSKKDCNFNKVALILGDFWNIMIINQMLENGQVRFGDFGMNINGLSNSVLSSRLKNLLESEIVNRESIQSMPPQVIYSLTSKGLGLKNSIEAMKETF